MLISMDSKQLKRRRVIYLDEAGAHPLFAINVAKPQSPTGGLMIDFGAYAPSDHWKYGLLEAPPGEEGQATLYQPNRVDLDGPPPKFHYHKNGYVSFNQTKRAPRKGMNFVPLSQLKKHTHAFTLMIVKPAEFRTSDIRTSDITIRTQGDHLSGIKIVGAFAPISLLPAPLLGDEEPVHFGLNQAGVSTIVVKLDGHSIPCYVSLEIHPNPNFRSDGDAAGLLVFAVDYDAAIDATRELPFIVMYSTPPT
jgi:hypothetical protein